MGAEDETPPHTADMEKQPTADSTHDRVSSEGPSDDGTPTTKQSGDAAPKKPEDAPAPKERSTARVALIMLSLMMAVFLAALDITIVTTAIPTIAEHFQSNSIYTWIGSAYLLACSAGVPLWGKISDIFGRKPMLLAANAIFFVGSLISGVAPNSGALIVGRAIQGIGGGGLVSLVNICIGDLFSQRRRGAYYGMIGGVWAIASSLGPIVGGAFTQKVSWRWCFYINLPVDGIAFAIILIFLDLKTPRTPLVAGLKAIDWLGSLLVVGGTLMFLFGLQYGGQAYPWDSATVICLLVFGVITLALFMLVEWKVAKYPVIPLRIFRFRSNIAALVVTFWHGFTFISTNYFLPLYFQAVLGKTPILSGVYLLPTSIALSGASIATGIFIRKKGLYIPPIMIGLTLMTLGVGLFINFDANSSLAKIILYQGVAGLGIGPNFQAPLIALQTLVAPQDIGTATATFGFIRQLATAISVVVGDVIIQNLLSQKRSELTANLGPRNANAIINGGVGASTQIINHLPAPQKVYAQMQIADALHYMWILYVVSAACGLVAGFAITKQVLKKDHVETKTGLEAEEQNRLEADRIIEEHAREQREQREARRKSKEVKRAEKSESPDKHGRRRWSREVKHKENDKEMA